MLHFTIEGEDYSIRLHLFKEEKIDPISWLQSQPLYPKVFWKEKHHDTIRVAAGAILLFPRIPSITQGTDPDIRFYGGMRFDSRVEGSEWQQFPQTCFWLPQIEMTCKGDFTEIRSYCLENKPVSSLPRQGGYPSNLNSEAARGDGKGKTPTRDSKLNRSDIPRFSEWEKLVETTLQAIRSGHISKLVLARRTTLQLDTPLSPFTLVTELLNQNTQSTLFAFQMSPSLSFLGATPEMLFKREGCHLTTEAIAGTRPKGSSSEEETQLEKELLCSEKDRREFKVVKKSLEATLLPLSKTGGWDGEDRVIKTAHLQHLYNRLSIELNTTLSDTDLVALLHPTPALGGYPKETALPLLKQLEPFDRGWYGAPIGVISSQSSAFYVAIRSALIKERQIHLFAGLGLIEGSCPKKEWEELNAKISWFMNGIKSDLQPS